MNKQELYKKLDKEQNKLKNNVPFYQLFAVVLNKVRQWVKELKLDEPEPSREECEIVETERNDYVSDFQCSKCKVCFDLFKWVYAPNTKVNYCPNCGAKIKREKRDE